MKLILIIFLVLLPLSANAAEFVNVNNAVDKAWIYTFNWKTSLFAEAAPVTIYEKNCKYFTAAELAHPERSPVPVVCFKEEAAARADAQIKADAFEKNNIKLGISSSDAAKAERAIGRHP